MAVVFIKMIVSMVMAAFVMMFVSTMMAVLIKMIASMMTVVFIMMIVSTMMAVLVMMFVSTMMTVFIEMIVSTMMAVFIKMIASTMTVVFIMMFVSMMMVALVMMAVIVMTGVFVKAHDGPRPGYAAPFVPNKVQFPARKAQGAQRGGQRFGVNPQVDKGPQRHVAGDACMAVEVQNLHTLFRASLSRINLVGKLCSPCLAAIIENTGVPCQ
jgi:hypothetical protein